MKLPKVEDVKNLIDTVKIAVDESDFGPMYLYPDQNDIAKRQVNQLALGVFTIVLSAFCKGLMEKN